MAHGSQTASKERKRQSYKQNVQTDYKSDYNGYRKWDSKSWFLDFDSLHHFKSLILYSQNIWIAFFFLWKVRSKIMIPIGFIVWLLEWDMNVQLYFYKIAAKLRLLNWWNIDKGYNRSVLNGKPGYIVIYFPGQWINDQRIKPSLIRAERLEKWECVDESELFPADDSCYYTSALPGGHLLRLTYTEPQNNLFLFITSCFMGK